MGTRAFVARVSFGGKTFFSRKMTIITYAVFLPVDAVGGLLDAAFRVYLDICLFKIRHIPSDTNVS